MKYFNYTVMGIVAIAVVAGFFVVGSPHSERNRRFDDQRIQDLQMIQGNIGEYFQAKSKLPLTLANLEDEFRGIVIPNDPETHRDYAYHVRGSDIFELCADFRLPSIYGRGALTPAIPKGPMPELFVGEQLWNHNAGRTCFERTIDKDFFQPKLK